MGEDIIVSEPNASALEKGVESCEFLVVQDIFFTETARYADVVLPAACFAEKEGVFTNSDRRVQRVRKAVDAPGEARADWEILCDLARAAGYAMPDYGHPREIYAEMASLCEKFAGISHERIDETNRMQWPCSELGEQGTRTLHADGPLRGKAAFQAVEYRPSDELPDEEYPLLLSTGRTLYHYNVGTQTRRDPGPEAKQPENFVEVNPHDAQDMNLEDGVRVKVESRRGQVGAKVLVSSRMRVGCVWMPFHYAEEPTNRLTNDAGDTVTGTGEYKVCAVRILTP